MATTLSVRFCSNGLAVSRRFIRSFSVSSTKKHDHRPVGFIGLGNMGRHMANNLAKSGYKVVVYDVVQSAVDEVSQTPGVEVGNSPSDVALRTDAIVTMLPSSPHVTEVYTGDNGIFKSIKTGTLLIDSSTIDPAVSQQMALVADKKGAVFMDAPVSGGVLAARDAGLTFMVGGPQTEFEAAKELLSIMGKNVVHCGDVGMGEATKICNNMILAVSMIGVSEAFNLGIKLGLDPKKFASVVNTATGRCWSSEQYNPCPGVLEGVPSSNEYKGGFGTALMHKDLGLAQNAAISSGTNTPLGAHALQVYRMMCNHGYGHLDFSSAFKFLQEQSDKV